MMNDKIAQSLGLNPIEKEMQGQVIVTSSPNNTTEVDFDYARGQMLNVIEKGQEALDGILDIAQRSQQPRSYEVVSDLIRTIAQTNKDLLELSKQKKDLEKTDGPKTINNNMFVGSTSELLKMLKDNDNNK